MSSLNKEENKAMSFKLCLAIPTHDNRVYYEFMKSFTSIIMYLDNQKIDYMVIHRVGSLINRSRNQIVSYFLASNSTHLLFLDNDICGFEHFVKKMVDLLRNDPLRVPKLCGGIYPIKEYNWNRLEQVAGLDLSPDKKKLYCMEFNINILPDNNNVREILGQSEGNHGLLKVRHIPGGCMLIDRQVFIKCMEVYPTRQYHPGVNESTVSLENSSSGELLYNFFDSFIHDYGGNRQYLSEDYGFCELWNQIGGEVYADIETTLGHFDGGVEYRGSYLSKIRLKVETFYALQQKEEKNQREEGKQNEPLDRDGNGNGNGNGNNGQEEKIKRNGKIRLPGIPEEDN